VPGRPGDELAIGTLNNISEAGRTKTLKKYLIIVEETSTGYSAFSPDVAGCGSTGRTKEDVERNIQEAIEFHLEGLREAGQEIPEPSTYSSYIDIAA
jgi:predicted RNase H-like HicB family nuclease